MKSKRVPKFELFMEALDRMAREKNKLSPGDNKENHIGAFIKLVNEVMSENKHSEEVKVMMDKIEKERKNSSKL